eukprot:TRINITY_DN29823_c0_g1_i1.p1 TRINITY_DN29823_c0_g1~~TRINITY_DN29823_c0_g1_i1.p1  ORF type:complete len:556 (+),score=164.37 TRINITY_DN29823_c0_g1_i1:45-1712(+)
MVKSPAARRAAVLVLLATAAAAAGSVPSQVHIALGKTEDSLNVAWATSSGKGASEVWWGTDAGNLTHRAVGDVRLFFADVFRWWHTRTAVLTGLAVGERYYYKVGDSVNGYSDVFSVRNRKAGPPYRHVLFGDMGASAAFSLCKACKADDRVCNATTCGKDVTAGLVSEVRGADPADMFLHVGDFGYNLNDDFGKVGDQFMHNIEQVAARVPYMVCHGNHEDSPGALAHYIERFRHMPTNAEPATYLTLNGRGANTMYYSWDFGMVHYIAMSTELFHLPVNLYSLTVTERSFLRWLEADLQAANRPERRALYPWIVVHGHRPLYSSSHDGADTKLRKALEGLFFKYGVSLSVNGHEHDYERSWPVYQGRSVQSYVDPPATVYVVTGAAGCKELHDPFAHARPGWVGFRSNTFGYTRMTVHNASHVHFQQMATDPTSFPASEYGAVIDDFWVVQRTHGPFNESRAPDTVQTTCDSALCGEHDHFAPLLRPRLGDTAGSGRPLSEVIAAYREKHGEVAWARHMQYLMDTVNRNGTWEDGVLDDKEQAAFKWIKHHKQ